MTKGKRILIPGPSNVTIEYFEIDETKLTPKEAIVKMHYTMISPGTELSIYTALDPTVYDPASWCHYPFKPGYVGVGEVLAKGLAIEQLDIGDMVYCLSNHASIFKINMGLFNHRNFCMKIPTNLDEKRVLLARLAVIALASVRVSSVEPGDMVAVLGLGLIGNFAAQLFELAGAEVIGSDMIKQRLELARKAGISHLVNPSEDSIREKVSYLTNGAGVDIAVDAVGDSEVVLQAMDLVRKMGEVIILGTPRASHQADLTAVFRKIHLDWVTLKGALEGCFPLYQTTGTKRSLEHDYHYVLNLLARGSLYTEGYVTHVIRPEKIQEAYDGLLKLKDRYYGVVIDWTCDSN